MENNIFIDIGHFQVPKHSEKAFGDVVQTKKITNHDTITVLSDGLGSGIKANVLASLTSRMALKYIEEKIDIHKAARIIMQTLPICKERKLRYSTFTIVTIESGTKANIIGYENPPFILIRNGEITTTPKRKITFASEIKGHNTIIHTSVPVRTGDRIVFFSDGVAQAGTGINENSQTWDMEMIGDYVLSLIKNKPAIPSGELSKKIVQKAASLDMYKPKDDITCCSIYIRKPKKCLLVTGPPYYQENDHLFAEKAVKFNGTRIICGGTTSEIIARECNVNFEIQYHKGNSIVPPGSNSTSFDLVTEGIITLSKIAEFLQMGLTSDKNDPIINALLELLLDSDQIHFLVGTRINESHQDPNLPVELDIRRNIIKKISGLLSKKFMKESMIEFI